MYEELVKRLREYSAARKGEIAELTAEAAGAIEKLDKDLEQSKEYEAFWNKEAEEALRRFQVAVASKPRWIPVTERLPERDGQVLTYYGFDHGDGYLGMMFIQALDYYANDPRPHFQHECFHGMKVTHWMPLPKPPEEET